MAKYFTEFLGTFFLVAIIGLSLGSGSPQYPLAIGLGLTALVYMGGHISGAHYNPAVTLAFLIHKKISWQDSLIYLLVQLAGAALGAFVTDILVQDQDFTFLIEPVGSADPVQILLAETIFSFLLVFVILNVAISERTRGNAYSGIAIGLTVLAGIYAVGEISGAAFNPAVGFGPNMIHLNFKPMWYYAVGPFVGGALAAFAFMLTEQQPQPRKKKAAPKKATPKREKAKAEGVGKD